MIQSSLFPDAGDAPSSTSLNLGLGDIVNLPPVVREQMAAQWIMQEDALSHQRAMTLLPHCNLIDSELLLQLQSSGYASYGSSGRQGLNVYLMTAFSRSSAPNALDYFLSCAKAQIPHALEAFIQRSKQPGQYGLSELTTLDDATSYFPASLKTTFGLPFLDAVLLNRTQSIDTLLDSPFPLHNLSNTSAPRRLLPDLHKQAGVEVSPFSGDSNPLAEVLSRGKPWRGVARRMIERPEFKVLLRQLFFTDPTPTGDDSIMALSERVDELKRFRTTPQAFEPAWPMFRQFLEQEALAGRDFDTLRPEWGADLLFSPIDDARDWAHARLSLTAKHKALDTCLKDDLLFKRQLSCTDPRGWDLALARDNIPALLCATAEDRSFLMRSVHRQTPEQFEHIVQRLQAVAPVALKAAFEATFWVVRQSGTRGMRKKGDFLAYCVAHNLPEHARAGRRVVPSSPNSIRYAKETVAYFTERDPTAYGTQSIAAWESVLLGDMLAEQKARKAAEAAAYALAHPEEAAAIPSEAPVRRRSNRL